MYKVTPNELTQLLTGREILGGAPTARSQWRDRRVRATD